MGQSRYGTGITRLRILKRLMKKAKGICYLCDHSLLHPTNKFNISIDHVISKTWGGKDSFENWAAVHDTCNHVKETQGAVKIFREMKIYLEMVHKRKNHRGLDTDPDVAHSIAQLYLYIHEMPELFGISYNHVVKNAGKLKNVIHRLQTVVEGFNFPEEILNRYVSHQYDDLERSRENNKDLLSVVKNPRVWYITNADLLKQIEQHELTFASGLKYLQTEHKNPASVEFVQEFLTDILLHEYANQSTELDLAS